MVTEKTELSLYTRWRKAEPETILFAKQEKNAIVNPLGVEELLFKSTLFSFYVLRRAIKAGLLIAREELLWFFRAR